MYPISVSAIFPCYNEERNIETLVDDATRALSRLVHSYEIIIINDGSADRTGKIADQLQQQNGTVRVIHHEVNKGYGATLISGFRSARYDWEFFTDGDNQFYMNEIELLLQEIDNHDAVIGFRTIRRDPWHRLLYAQSWNMLVRLVFGLRVKDLNCAFKIIKKKYLDEIDLTSSGTMVNTKLLVSLKMARHTSRR